jgi:hypothetical protein
VREEFRLDGVHHAFSVTASAVLLLRDMLAQIDLGGEALLIYEGKVKNGYAGRFFVGKSGSGTGDSGRAGSQICLAHICDVHLGWSPGTWLGCYANCSRRHLGALELVGAKGEVSELVNNLHKIDGKMRAELLKRLEDFCSKA